MRMPEVIKMRKRRFIVYELELSTHHVNDVFGIFYSYDRAEKLCKKLQREHDDNLLYYGIRELLHGATWLK